MNPYEAKISIVMLIEVLNVVDRTLLHALLPDVPFGTHSGRLVDLLNAGQIEETGEDADRNIPEMRRVFGLPDDWNPVAAKKGVRIHMGDQSTKRYRKTKDWSFYKACKVLLGEP